MPEWFWFTLAAVVYIMVICLAFGVGAYLFEEDRAVLAVLIAVLALFFAIGVPVWYTSKDDGGYEEWRGGAGSETRCEYVEKTVMVNKVPTQKTYTRCYK